MRKILMLRLLVEKMTRLKVLKLTILPLIILPLITSCSNEPTVEVTTAKVSSYNALTLTQDGKISTSDALKIYSPISGNVTEKYVEDGSDVEERQKLFKVGAADDSFELAQKKAALAESMTALAKARVDKNPTAAELQLAVEENKRLVQEMEDAAAQGIIYAPKSGQLEMSLPIGMSVVANETVLATVGNANPVVVTAEFSAAEKKVLSAVDDLKITLRLADGATIDGGYFKGGEIYFDNPDETLILGAPAQVVIDLKIPNALLIPEDAIQKSGAENFVYIDDNNKAAVRKIQLGDKIGTYYIVKDGLKADDSIITKGFKNLREGTPLKSNS